MPTPSSPSRTTSPHCWPTCAHGRIETRRIWTTTTLTGDLTFPGVAQAFCIEREVIEKRTGKTTTEVVYGSTSHTPQPADAARLLCLNRRHWCIENSCHDVIDWNWDEDRRTIRTGFGPENTTRLRRFAIGRIKAKSTDSAAATIRRLQRKPRSAFDYLHMTKNSNRFMRQSAPVGG
jgi:predicted transposase YbfD/YdcC